MPNSGSGTSFRRPSLDEAPERTGQLITHDRPPAEPVDQYRVASRQDANKIGLSRRGSGAGAAVGADGGAATSAQFDSPMSLAAFGGVLYVADQVNDRIRTVVFDDVFRAGFEN